MRRGVPWRDLPKKFGPWQSVYTRFSRWGHQGFFDQIFEVVQDSLELDDLSLDSSTVKDGNLLLRHASASKQKVVSEDFAAYIKQRKKDKSWPSAGMNLMGL